VRVEPDVGLLDELDDPKRTRDPLRAPDVAADDVEDAGGDQCLEPARVPLALTAGDQRLDVVAQLAEALDVVGLQRLLDPLEVVLLEGVRAADRLPQVPVQRLPAVHHDHGVRPDRLAQQAHELDVAVDLVAQPGAAALAHADLHADVALLAHVAAVAIGLVLEARVEHVRRGERRKLLPVRPADQVDERLAQQLALEVPERDVDR
jgi:hypothetical protein